MAQVLHVADIPVTLPSIGDVGGEDACLSLFGAVYGTGAIKFPRGASVLEIGCAEADWMSAILADRPDLRITGIDWRPCRRPGLTIRGDVLTVDFPEASFDAVVGISSIEHIGLGHYDKDPLDPDGDIACCRRIARWLKPGGIFYADVPVAPAYYVHGTDYRAYDEPAWRSRLVGPLRVTTVHYGNGRGELIAQPDWSDPQLNYVAICAVKES